MEKEELHSYEKAFIVAEDAIEFSKKLLKENVKAIDIAEAVEKRIFEIGAKPAWPVNISINEIAAHYTPSKNDELVLKNGDLVKVDIGAHVNGHICDRAYTICIGAKTHPLIEASEKALDKVLKMFTPGTTVSEISQVTEDSVSEMGFTTIKNLAGHRLERYQQHAYPSIPNSKNSSTEEIESGKVYAMEIFVTDGSGMVVDSSPTGIFQYNKDATVRLWEARQLLEISKTNFEKLPFTQRWIGNISPLKIGLALQQLIEAGAFNEYPPLKEESNGMVAVTEKSVVVK